MEAGQRVPGGKGEAAARDSLIIVLARLIGRAAERSQVFVVSHAATLIDALQQQPECHSIVLDKAFGETRVVDADERGRPSWQWPAR